MDLDFKFVNLKTFLTNSPVSFYAVDTLKTVLEANGFRHLDMAAKWDLKPNGRYFVTKNGTALFAFVVADPSLVADDTPAPFQIIAAHSDSPGFRVKPNCEMVCDGNIVKLNTEVYGGPILYTWFDRPLSLAGRAICRGADAMHPEERLVNFSDPMLTIPHLAIHFNRAVNEGNKLSRQDDMLPVLGHVNSNADAKGLIKRRVAEELGVDADEVIDFDLFLYDTTAPTIWGPDDDYISAGRLDDLSMVHSGLLAMTSSASKATGAHRVLAIFDNEETGSGTKQGANSPFFDQILRRIHTATASGDDQADYYRAIEGSFMISADDAHAIHPNYPGKHDPTNHPVLGGGPVIKINAAGKYMTDAASAAVFSQLCQQAGVPCQTFVNHSDMAGGSTLGNILTSQVALRGVDVGAPIWAMHSVRETASLTDHRQMVAVFEQFYHQYC